MKKGVIGILILLAMIGFVNAASISDLLDSIEQSTVVLYAVFILSFLIVFFALSKSVFKANTTIAGVIAGVVAFLVTYFLNKTGFDFEGFFIDIGLSESTISFIISLIVLAGIAFAIIKWKLDSLWLFGILLIAISFIVEEGITLLTIGVILIILRLILMGLGIGKNKGDLINNKKLKEILQGK